MDKNKAYQVVVAVVQKVELTHQDWITVTQALRALAPEEPQPPKVEKKGGKK